MPTSERDETEFLSTPEAASLLGVHRSTLTRWADAGNIPFAHRGAGSNGAYVFRRADIEARLAVAQ